MKKISVQAHYVPNPNLNFWRPAFVARVHVYWRIGEKRFGQVKVLSVWPFITVVSLSFAYIWLLLELALQLLVRGTKRS